MGSKVFLKSCQKGLFRHVRVKGVRQPRKIEAARGSLTDLLPISTLIAGCTAGARCMCQVFSLEPLKEPEAMGKLSAEMDSSPLIHFVNPWDPIVSASRPSCKVPSVCTCGYGCGCKCAKAYGDQVKTCVHLP